MTARTSGGNFRLFTFRGIDVFVHWSWLLVAVLAFQWRSDAYDSAMWNILEYLALFGIVLLHEFGHALACRSVGGKADRILLWPLGGVAYVRPPQRPGAMLWSIAAGPLVNLVLLPISLGVLFAIALLFPHAPTDLVHAVEALGAINFVLLVFNLLPIYPLDGGQILRSLLWYGVGPDRSLLIASSIGLVVSVVGGVAVVLTLGDFWLGLIAAYAAWRSLTALRVSRARIALLGGPHQPLARCPVCGEAPPLGPLWRCPEGHPLDPFQTGGACPAPGCEARVQDSPCPYCGEASPIAAYGVPTA